MVVVAPAAWRCQRWQLDNNNVFLNDYLYCQWCRARRPVSLVYASSSCLPNGSKIVLRYQNPHVLTSLAVCPSRGRGGGESNDGGGNGGTTGDPDRARDALLCYGDRIALQSRATRCILGIRRAERRTPRPTPKYQ